jgi:hypothetical protein
MAAARLAKFQCPTSLDSIGEIHSYQAGGAVSQQLFAVDVPMHALTITSISETTVACHVAGLNSVTPRLDMSIQGRECGFVPCPKLTGRTVPTSV